MNHQINKNLSIVIPSYNRSSILDKSLEIHIPLAKKYNIPIYISDNASVDDTYLTVKKWNKDYEFLFYSKNQKNVDTDSNVAIALKIPTTKYIWLLGDSSKLSSNIFNEIANLVIDNYDLIVLNDNARVDFVETQVVDDKFFLLSELGWTMTQMSSLIFNRNIIINSNFQRYEYTSFRHLGIIFEYFAYKDNILVSWNQHLSVERIQIDGIKKKSWQKDTFKIWIEKWPNFVLSLPPVYNIGLKLKMISLHNNKTKLFSISNLLLLRMNGHYNLKVLFSYWKYFQIALGKGSNTKFLLIAIFPKKIIKLFLFLFRTFFKQNT